MKQEWRDLVTLHALALCSCPLALRQDLQLICVQGRRHDFGIGGAELELGRKLCVRLRTRKFLTTPAPKAPPPVPTPLVCRVKPSRRASSCLKVCFCACFQGQGSGGRWD